MRISYLELKNYRKFRQLRMQFPDGMIGILGMNGVGKTTIIEAIAWALFGNVDEVVRTSREGVRRVGASPADPCLAIVEFELGGVEYRIEREMSGRSLHMRASLRTKDKLLADGDRPVKNMVEKLLGMDSKSFFTSVFARQRELNALQNVAPGERKKVILRMLRIDSIDTVLTSIRSDRNSIHSRIEGSERTLLTEDGREREKVLAESLPDMRQALNRSTKELEEAQAQELDIAKNLEEARGRRNELKKDVEAYNTTQGDLRGIASSIEVLIRQRDNIAAKLEKETPRLSRMPTLAKDDEDWKNISAKREELEREKATADKAKLLAEAITEDEQELERRRQELASLRKSVVDLGDIEFRIQEIETARTQCDEQRQIVLNEMAKLKATIRQRSESSERDLKKLEDIEAAGPEGSCPTCEQRLEGSYELLMKKLRTELDSARREIEQAQISVADLELEVKGLAKKEEALKKKRSRLDLDRTRLDKARATASASETEISNLEQRLAKKRKDLGSLGKIRFKLEEYEGVLNEQERLKHAHDDYMNLKSLEGQIQNLNRDLIEVGERIARASAEADKYRSLVAILEPKKNAYDSILHEIDAKNASLVDAKERVGKISSTRERERVELERIGKEMTEIERVRKAIEKDRRMEDDLSVLEEVVVNFRMDLIGRISPALAALTSMGLRSMTEDRYSKVELDENYEMQIDDQGTMYPVSRFSGGESDLANLCLRLAISGIIADRTGANPINILILDEIFGSLDPSRKRSVMAALSRLSGQFRQVFLITHIEDIKDMMNHIIRVQELEDGSSGAELVS